MRPGLTPRAGRAGAARPPLRTRASSRGLLDQDVVSAASKVPEAASTAPAMSVPISADEIREHGIRSSDEAINFLAIGMQIEKLYCNGELGARGVLLSRDAGAHVLLRAALRPEAPPSGCPWSPRPRATRGSRTRCPGSGRRWRSRRATSRGGPSMTTRGSWPSSSERRWSCVPPSAGRFRSRVCHVASAPTMPRATSAHTGSALARRMARRAPSSRWIRSASAWALTRPVSFSRVTALRVELGKTVGWRRRSTSSGANHPPSRAVGSVKSTAVM